MNSAAPVAEERECWLSRALLLLLAIAVARLWLMPLSSSFWVDELLTYFVVHHGTAHPSLSVAPQVSASLYYLLPRVAESLLGFSEIAYRLPSVLAMAVALWLIGRLAARLIHPHAAWFAVFAGLALGGINYQAADARPYALGTCLAAAGFFFLVRWMDKGRRWDALFFVACAALLWRVHLIYWPLYIVFLLYAATRIRLRQTSVRWPHALAAMAGVAVLLLPVLFNALAILPQAASHAYAAVPEFRELFNSLKLGLVLAGGVGAYLVRRGWPAGQPDGNPRNGWCEPMPSLPTMVLIGGWWLLHPLCLFAYSHVSGNSVFLHRYLFVALPGAVLAAVGVAGVLLPPERWRHAALLLGVGVLLLMGQWRTAWPRHDRSDWRGAARRLHELRLEPDTPVIVPSPFYEARPPAWTPDYPLPGFLYAHLEAYPIAGTPLLFPFNPELEAFGYAEELLRDRLPASGRFAIYGGDRNVRIWRDWLAGRPELAGWRHQTDRRFGDVWVAMFERAPAAAAH